MPPPPASAQTYAVYLVGDAGKCKPGDATMATLAAHLGQAGPNSAVVFLGDNIYDHGLRPPSHPEYPQDTAYLMAQLRTTQGYPGRVYAIPGNHDWDEQGPQGLANVQRQEALVEQVVTQNPDAFIPSGGCPGPVVKRLDDRHTLVAIDTQWWLHNYKRPEGDTSPCLIKDPNFFFQAVHDSLEAHRGENLLVVGHHPIRSNGPHGGRFGWKAHLFPLTMIWPKAYVPLPLLGSGLVGLRLASGHSTDMTHHDYQVMVEWMTPFLEEQPGLVYAAGHDHNLQHFPLNGIHYVVSGAGAKASPAVHGHGAAFVHGGRGFFVLRTYGDHGRWLEAVVPSPGNPMGRVVYRTPLDAEPPAHTAAAQPAPRRSSPQPHAAPR